MRVLLHRATRVRGLRFNGLRWVIGAGCVLALMGVATGRDLGRETLAPNDGWAASGAGVTGGSLATPEQIYTVHTRAELIAALNDGVPSSTSPANPSNAPKIIYVDGTLSFNVDDAGNPLACEDYYRNGYTLEAFLATYDPAVWGRVAPAGPLETARLASRGSTFAAPPASRTAARTSSSAT